jgi:hypothetical protein
MWNPKSQSLLISVLCFVSALSSRATAASNGGKPLLVAVTKDASTSLYTAPLKDGRPLVLDLSSPRISLTCSAGTTNKQGTVTTTLSANATDGKNPLYPVSFPAVATCAPLPPPAAGGAAVGVAGLAPSGQSSSLPAQVARTQKVANKMALCLPSDGKSTSGDSVGVAIFGGGPFFFIPSDRGDFTTMLAGTAPFRRLPESNNNNNNGGSPGYFIPATGIAVEQKQLAVGGPLVIGLSSTTPYTALRPDVYGALVEAWDEAASSSGSSFPAWMQRVPAVAPFERCYNATRLSVSLSRLGYGVPRIDLALAGGDTFSVVGGNSMVQVSADTACLGFVAGGKGQAPAAVLGGFQLENRLLVIDGEKQQIGFTTFLNAIGLSCSNFNFTRAAA